MATTSKLFYRGTAETGPTNLYSVPAATTAVITSILISNNSTDATTVAMSILVDDVISPGFAPVFIPTITIPGRSFISVDLKQVMNSDETISGRASEGELVSFHISGVEIS